MEQLPDFLWPTADVRAPAAGLTGSDPWFLLSYGLGLLVIMIFSWHRLFNEHISGEDDETYKIFGLLPPGDLRGTLTLLRAYAVYVLLIGGTYTLISFAGAFLLKVIEVLSLGEMVGFSFNPDGNPLQVDDPAWPLGVSLAFVGILKHIPQLSRLEATVRRWAHQSIGIPPFIKQLTHNVQRTSLMQIDGAAASNPRKTANDDVFAVFGRISPNRDIAEDQRKLDRISIFDGLVLDDLTPWPSSRVSARFEHMIKALRADVSNLFDDADGAALLLDDVSRTAPDDRDTRKNDQATRKVAELSAKIATVHRDLSSGIAVLIENDPVIPDHASPVLRKFAENVRADDETSNWLMDKLLGILVTLATCIFFATWLATTFKLNPPFGSFGALGTTLIQTGIMVAIYVPAALVGLYRQQHLSRLDRWRAWNSGNRAGTYPLGQYAGIFLIAYAIGLVIITLLYFCLFMAITPDLDNARTLFMLFLPVYFAFTLLSGIQAAFSAFASSEVQACDSPRRLRVSAVHGVLTLMVLAVFYQSYSDLLAGSDSNAVIVYWFLIVKSATVAFFATYLSANPQVDEEEDITAPDAILEPAQ